MLMHLHARLIDCQILQGTLEGLVVQRLQAAILIGTEQQDVTLALVRLDWHGSLEEYARAKGKVYANTEVACIYNVQDEPVGFIARWMGTFGNGEILPEGDETEALSDPRVSSSDSVVRVRR